MADDLVTVARKLGEAINVQNKRAHLGFVITAAAIMDSHLERALKKAMKPLSKKNYERLFDAFGPLSSFASKIIIAYALGIISTEIYEKLEAIRKLRNKMSHSSKLLDLGSNEIEPLLLALNPQTKPNSLDSFMDCIKETDAVLEAYLADGE